MDSAKLNDWLQVIGVFGVIAGLVFVGLQLKQTQEIALAAQQHARAETMQNFWLAALESGFDFSTLNMPIAELTEDEFNARWAISNWMWTGLENHHFQYGEGFVSEESWQAIKNIIVYSWSSEVANRAFQERKDRFRPSFVDFVEQLTKEPSK